MEYGITFSGWQLSLTEPNSSVRLLQDCVGDLYSLSRIGLLHYKALCSNCSLDKAMVRIITFVLIDHFTRDLQDVLSLMGYVVLSKVFFNGINALQSLLWPTVLIQFVQTAFKMIEILKSEIYTLLQVIL